MSPISVIITIAAYFVILFTISYIAGRKADNEGFFVGNRKSAWYVVAFAMIGSSISGVTYVSVPGMVAASSFGYLQMVLGFVAGQFIIAFVLTPLFYRMNLVSIYEYLENRFGMSSVNIACFSCCRFGWRPDFSGPVCIRYKRPQETTQTKTLFLSFCNLNIHTYVYQYFTFVREGREIFAVFVWKSGKFAIFVVQVIRYR